MSESAKLQVDALTAAGLLDSKGSAGDRPTSSDGSMVSKHAVQTSGMDQSARPSPMGSRSRDVEKIIACGVAGVAPGPSDSVPGECEEGVQPHPQSPASGAAGAQPAAPASIGEKHR